MVRDFNRVGSRFARGNNPGHVCVRPASGLSLPSSKQAVRRHTPSSICRSSRNLKHSSMWFLPQQTALHQLPFVSLMKRLTVSSSKARIVALTANSSQSSATRSIVCLAVSPFINSAKARASSARWCQFGVVEPRRSGHGTMVPRAVIPFNSEDGMWFLFQPDLGRPSKRQTRSRRGG